MPKVLVAWVVVLLLGCQKSCGCGSEHASTAAPEAKNAVQDKPQSDKPQSEKQGAPQAPRFVGAQSNLREMPDSGVRQAIEARAQKVEWQERIADTIAPQVLEPVLPSELGDYRAQAATAVATSQSPEGRAAIVEREYRGEHKETLRLKLSDTAELASMRSATRAQITVAGTSSNGEQTGALIAGEPGVSSYDKQRRVSRAIVLMQGRYLAEAMVVGTDVADAAKRALEALPLAKLPRPQAPKAKSSKSKASEQR